MLFFFFWFIQCVKGSKKEAGVTISHQALAWRQQMAVLLSGYMQCEDCLGDAM